MGVNCW